MLKPLFCYIFGYEICGTQNESRTFPIFIHGMSNKRSILYSFLQPFIGPYLFCSGPKLVFYWPQKREPPPQPRKQMAHMYSITGVVKLMYNSLTKFPPPVTFTSTRLPVCPNSFLPNFLLITDSPQLNYRHFFFLLFFIKFSRIFHMEMIIILSNV